MQASCRTGLTLRALLLILSDSHDISQQFVSGEILPNSPGFQNQIKKTRNSAEGKKLPPIQRKSAPHESAHLLSKLREAESKQSIACRRCVSVPLLESGRVDEAEEAVQVQISFTAPRNAASRSLSPEIQTKSRGKCEPIEFSQWAMQRNQLPEHISDSPSTQKNAECPKSTRRDSPMEASSSALARAAAASRAFIATASPSAPSGIDRLPRTVHWRSDFATVQMDCTHHCAAYALNPRS